MNESQFVYFFLKTDLDFINKQMRLAFIEYNFFIKNKYIDSECKDKNMFKNNTHPDVQIIHSLFFFVKFFFKKKKSCLFADLWFMRNPSQEVHFLSLNLVKCKENQLR